MSISQSPLQVPPDDLDQVVASVGNRWEAMRGSQVLLTGGTGFIGKWMIGTFLHANREFDLRAKLVVLSRNPERFLQDFPILRNHPDITWIAEDVRRFDSEIASRCRFTIHGATDVVRTNLPSTTIETCVTGTQQVLRNVARQNVDHRFLLLSSGAIYGRIPPHIDRVSESWSGAPDHLNPASAYAEGKRVSELMCVAAATEHPQLTVAIARCFAFVGPHLPLDQHFAIGNFIEAALRNRDIVVKGDGTPVRSYLYASDLAIHLWTLLFSASGGQAYNVGGEERVSVAELAYRVRAVLNGKGRVVVSEEPTPDVPPQTYLPCTKRVALELGLRPTVTLDQAISRTAAWARTYQPSMR